LRRPEWKGKPEPLRENLSGFWSRRIDDVNRLVYTVDGADLAIIACRYHYEQACRQGAAARRGASSAFFGANSSFVRDGASHARRHWAACWLRGRVAGAVRHGTHHERTQTMHKRIVLAAAYAALTACAGLPSLDAGMSRRDLEAKGGKRVAATDLRQSITGALVSGRTLSGKGGFWDWDLGADGAVNGTYTNQYGAFQQTGKWHVAEDGKFCYAVSGSGSAESGGNLGGCQEWYRLGADLYAVEGTLAMKREVIRR